MKKKYLLVTAEAEPNIGVIDLSTVVGFGLQSRLEKVLGEHFDADVAVGEIQMKSESPFTATVLAEIHAGGDEQDRFNLYINLDETWVY